MLLVSGCFFISPVRSQFGFFGPLLPPSTVYNISTSTVSLTVGTICYIPVTANITQCRRRRGIEVEQPDYIVDGVANKIMPAQVLRYKSLILSQFLFFLTNTKQLVSVISIETTALPPAIEQQRGIQRRAAKYEKVGKPLPAAPAAAAGAGPSFPELLLRSSQITEDEAEDEGNQVQSRTLMNNFMNRLAADPREINMFNSIVVSSSCAGEPLNFSELLTCIGVTVQQTTTLTATLTVTQTTVFGFTEITLGGCTPANFPYPSCQPSSSSSSSSSSDSIAPTSTITTPPPTTAG